MITKVRLFMLIAALILSSFASISSTPNAARARDTFKFSMVEGSWAQVRQVVPAGAQIDPYSYDLKSDNNIQIVTACPRTPMCWDMNNHVFSEIVPGTFWNWAHDHRDTIWLVDNEPTISYTEYAKFYKWVAETVESATGTDHPWVVFCQTKDANYTYCEQAYYALIEEMGGLENGGRQKAIDAIYRISTHNYISSGDYYSNLREDKLPGAVNTWIKEMNDFKDWANRVDNHALADKPLWVTEFGSLDAWCPGALPGAYGGCPANAVRNDERMDDDYVFYGRNNREGLWGVQHATIDYFNNPYNEPGKNQGDWEAAWWFRNEMGDWGPGYDGKNRTGECVDTAWLFGDNTDCDQSTNQDQVSRAGSTYYYEIYPYTGLDQAWLPDVKGNSNGWNSTIVIRNNSAEFANNASIRFYNASGGSPVAPVIVPRIAPNGTEIVNVSNIVSNFSGAAIVTARYDAAVVVVNRSTTTPAAYAYSSRSPANAPATTLYLPETLDLGTWQMRFPVFNLGTAATNITTQFLNPDGSTRSTQVAYTVPINGQSGEFPLWDLDPANGYLGVGRISANQPIAAVARAFDNTSRSLGYWATTFPHTTVWLPFVMMGLNNGWGATIWVQNTTGTPSTVSLDFFQEGSRTRAGTTGPVALPANGLTSFNLRTNNYGLPPGWVGSARVNAGQPVVVVVNQLNDGSNLGASYEGAPALNDSYRIILPYVVRGDGGCLYSNFAVSNMSSSDAAVTIYYYQSTGALTATSTDTIVSNRVYNLYAGTPAGQNFPAPPFNGSVRIVSTQPLAVSSNVLNYCGGDAISYTGLGR